MSKISNVFVISAKAPRLADLVSGAAELGDKVTVLFVGDAAEAGDVFASGADVLCTFPKKEGVIFEDYSESMAAAIKAADKSLVVLPADRRGKAMAAKLGASLSAPVANEATSIEISDAEVTIKHLIYGGLAEGEEVSSADVVIATIGSGVFEANTSASKSGETIEGAFVAPAATIKLLEVKPMSGTTVDLSKAKRVVTVGRGFGKEEDISMARDLAEAIDAEIACSRPVAEVEGWIERERYIGVSGQRLNADVYFAIGVSGQIQHMVGANGSKTIVAINKDKSAPIFGFADYGIVGDLYKILPEVVKALKG